MLALAGFVALAMLAGCGGYTPEAGVIVTGKVVQGGQPVPAPSSATGSEGSYGVEVQILAASPSDTKLASTGASCDASGNFEITYGGAGVPPGKYKVAIYVRNGDGDSDTLEGKLDATNTKIEVDVPQDKLGGKHDVGTIDIATHLK